MSLWNDDTRWYLRVCVFFWIYLSGYNMHSLNLSDKQTENADILGTRIENYFIYCFSHVLAHILSLVHPIAPIFC
jgi:hypothetical protein